MMKKHLRGHLLLEVMVAMGILVALIGAIFPALRDFEQAKQRREFILAGMRLEQMIQDQLQAQLTRLGRSGCAVSTQQIAIGKAAFPTGRITNVTLDSGSDWLHGTDIGLCTNYGVKTGAKVTVSMSCDGLNTGDSLQISNCADVGTAAILSISGADLVATSAQENLEGPVLVSSKQEFYWYISQGKAGNKALWRKPNESGNALELLPGLEHLRIYPILDKSQDGIADEVYTGFGVIPVAELSGVLVEYFYRVAGCKDGSMPRQSYRTLRGDQWDYDGICTGIGKQIITVGNL